MSRTFVRQATQIRTSDTYDDTLAAGSALESGAVSIEDDLNGLRSQVQKVIGVVNWYDALAGRSIAGLDTDLTDLEGKRVLCGVQMLTDVTVPAAVAASGTLTGTGNFSDGETVTISTYGGTGGKTYTFQTTLTDVDGNVQIGVDLATSLANLKAAINLDAGAGTLYAASTTLHPAVSATNTPTTVVATAKKPGTYGNTVATTDTAANASWGSATLSGGSGGDVVVLSQAGGETPSDTAAISTGLGAVVAVLSGDVGTADLTEIAGSNALSPKNLLAIRDAVTKDAIVDGDYQVWGLLQAESGVVQDDAFNDSDKQVQITFVVNNGSDDLAVVSGSVMGGKTIEYMYPKRVTFDTFPEDCAWPPSFQDRVAAVDVTLDNAIDNQTGPATQDQDIDIRITDTYSWAFQDSTGAVDILRVDALSGGDEVEFNVANFDVNNTNDADFSGGAKFDTGGTEIDIGVTAGYIESTGANDLGIRAAGELYLDDGNQVGSTWAQTGGVKLSETTAEWDAYEAAFGGEVSLLNAIVQAKNANNRNKTVAVVTSTTVADTNVGGSGGGTNLDAQLGDYSGVTSFQDEVDVYLNGVLLRGDNSTTGANDHDVYPGTSPALGQLKFEFPVRINDVITMIIYDATP